MTDLYDAVRAFDERKRLLLEAGEGVLEGDVARLLIVGLDVDFNQVAVLANQWARLAVRAVAVDHVDSFAVLTGGWVDGLMTGLLLADLRAREPVE